MLSQILEIVRENAGEAIINNPVIPNKKNSAAIKTASGSIVKNLQKMAGSGELDAIKGMFAGEGQVENNPVINQLSGNVAGDLMKKFGLDKGAASGIVQQLLPIVMKKFVQKTNDPKDNSINLESVLGSLMSGKSKSGGGLLGNLLKGFLKR
ncbi:MAG TPA: hypothetical protein P5228_03015 [Bacteroidales bacterium]|nr:hypothetical protein [Bacteroidales bacterium]HRZ49790.1 hypothetical protein [Bacteroidales bacterium]